MELDKTTKRIRISTCILVAVLQLQVFRRLSWVAYMGILLIAYAYWFKTIPFSRKVRVAGNGFLFLACYLFLPVLSLLTMPVDEFITAFIRYGAVMPFLVISFLYSDVIYDNISDLAKIYVLVVVASAVLMVYQVPFGRIWFFADDAARRLGYERYGSLMGSTTTYGTASLAAIMCLHDFQPFKKWVNVICEILIIIGGILCLSKAFFINVAFTYVLIFVFGTGRKQNISINKILGVIVTVAAVFAILYFTIKNTFIGNYFRDMFRYSFLDSGLGVNATLNERLTTRPANTFAFHGMPYIYYAILGVGFKGYSGVLGLTKYPMCHNNYFDILLAQGLPALLSLLSVYVLAFVGTRKYKSPQTCLVRQLVPFILVNMLAGQWIYLSVDASLFLCIIFSVYNNRGRIAEDG